MFRTCHAPTTSAPLHHARPLDTRKNAKPAARRRACRSASKTIAGRLCRVLRTRRSCCNLPGGNNTRGVQRIAVPATRRARLPKELAPARSLRPRSPRASRLGCGKTLLETRARGSRVRLTRDYSLILEPRSRRLARRGAAHPFSLRGCMAAAQPSAQSASPPPAAEMRALSSVYSARCRYPTASPISPFASASSPRHLRGGRRRRDAREARWRGRDVGESRVRLPPAPVYGARVGPRGQRTATRFP